MKNLFYVLCLGIVIQSMGILIFGLTNDLPPGTVIGIMVVTLLPLAGINVSFTFVHDWVFQELEGKNIPGGLPFWIWGIIALFTILSFIFIFVGTAAPWGLDMSILMVGSGFLFATFWSVLTWFLCWKDSTQFFSEHEAKMHFCERGLTDEAISEEIDRLRAKGLLTVVDVKK